MSDLSVIQYTAACPHGVLAKPSKKSMMIKENVMNFVKAQFLPFKVYNLFTNDF
jgi:hypothetical protein